MALADFESLRARYDADRAAERAGRRGVVEARLVLALDAIGWRSAGGESSEEVAREAQHVLGACVSAHHDTRRCARELGELLRVSSAALDGGGASAAAFIPAAEEVLARFAGTHAPGTTTRG